MDAGGAVPLRADLPGEVVTVALAVGKYDDFGFRVFNLLQERNKLLFFVVAVALQDLFVLCCVVLYSEYVRHQKSVVD